jgi:hypothetical protein
MSLKSETICWSCKFATGGCSWALDGTPVEGWEATKTVLRCNDRSTTSYIVRKCPQYKFDKLEVRIADLCKLLNISERTFYRSSRDILMTRLTNAGYNVSVTADGKFVVKAKEVDIL